MYTYVCLYTYISQRTSGLPPLREDLEHREAVQAELRQGQHTNPHLGLINEPPLICFSPSKLYCSLFIYYLKGHLGDRPSSLKARPPKK